MGGKGFERLSVVSSVAVVAGAVVLATLSDRDWSWTLFVWGPVIGTVAAAWAYGSTRMFAVYLQGRAGSAESARIRERARSLGRRQRFTYVDALAFGIAVGVVSGAWRAAALDVGFAAAWLLFGLLPPLAAFVVLARRLGRVDQG